MRDEGLRGLGAGWEAQAPGLAMLSRRGHLSELDGRLHVHLGVEHLPESVGSVEELLLAAGFQRRPG
ncbi:MAG TPA: sensor histidine kinase, partial [Archangium sp.]